ncbi:Extracellular exo-alpha-L-arabinofuranosidase precursor [Planctomycetes bacterium CA13]|uniref:non-reducing end alpha-L-arabinofuranosidase n=1 Tax=Novipirellula herctigrandis TaxID=2527986 RepID=A0A5C5ZCY4_9BACT|nr:Extracellular exo-alpha-L-arabinofuranosidase precursor [Planctomycetes bacterium CA13]
MKSFMLRWLFALSMLVGMAVSIADAADATVRVDCRDGGHSISDRLVGAFFEDINFGADGGFSAEQVINRSLEISRPLVGWMKIGADVSMTAENESPIKAANPTFLRLATESESPTGGVENRGFRGMGVRDGETYRFTAQGRSTAGAKMKLAVRLVAENDEVLAEQFVTLGGSAWHTTEVDLVPKRTESKARLQLLLRSKGIVDLDLISLCTTDTWMGRPHGLRKDLVQLLADMKPAFFRFPGGCIVEGSQLKYRYQWKTTIGPRDERRLIVNRWNNEFAHRPTPDYYQSFEIGFFEYFQLAEDLGAEPMPIINCGMACQFNSGELVPLEELEPYIQDALDLIEFANGPIESEWGSRRAAMGHPEPFGMRLLGVGNEQWGPEYFERYRRFAEVLQSRYPDVELISTSGPFPAGERFDFAWPLLRNLKVPIVDEHCYATPDWFMREATRYDHYDRKGPRIFMGEYASQSVQLVCPQNRNTLRCALAEAAFLTGIERNGDIVDMSAYAPLMAHEEAWQWRPNLLWFDNLTSYGSPSYYTQLLFSHHHGDQTRPTTVTDTRPSRQPRGRIGVGSTDASVEYKGIKFESGGDVLFDQRDIKDDDVLKVGIGSRWNVTPEVTRQTSRGGYTRAMMGDYRWSDGTLTLQARKVAGRGGLMVLFRNTDGGSRIEWNIGAGGKHQLLSRQATHWDVPVVADETPGTIEDGKWYDVRVELDGTRVKCYLNDNLVHDVDMPDPHIAQLFAIGSVDNDSGETIVKIVNPTAKSVEVDVDLAGAELASDTCQVITLAADNPEAENSIAEPKHVAPQTSTETVSGARFTREFPAWSFTVMRLKTQ